MEGFDIKLEGMFGGQVIPLLSVDGSIQGEVKNWSSAVCQSRESFATNILYWVANKCLGPNSLLL